MVVDFLNLKFLFYWNKFDKSVCTYWELFIFLEKIEKYKTTEGVIFWTRATQLRRAYPLCAEFARVGCACVE